MAQKLYKENKDSNYEVLNLFGAINRMTEIELFIALCLQTEARQV